MQDENHSNGCSSNARDRFGDMAPMHRPVRVPWLMAESVLDPGGKKGDFAAHIWRPAVNHAH